MSRALAAADRVRNDAYYTDPRLALAMCERIRDGWHVDPAVIVEPSAGRGAFVAAARATWPSARIIAVDVDARSRVPCLRAGADVFIRGSWPRLARQLAGGRGGSLLVLGNPPFRKAESHIDATRSHLVTGDCLVFLLRLNFLGATKRADWWREARDFMRTDTIFPRPSFRGAGNDATEYAAFGWTPGQKGPAIHGPPLIWRELKTRRR